MKIILARVFQNILAAEKLNDVVLKDCFEDRNAVVTISSDYGDFDTYRMKSGSGTPKTPLTGFTLVKVGDELYPAKITVVI